MTIPKKSPLQILATCRSVGGDCVFNHEGDFMDAFGLITEDAECRKQLMELLAVAAMRYREPEMLHRYFYGPASALTKRMAEMAVEYLEDRESRMEENL